MLRLVSTRKKTHILNLLKLSDSPAFPKSPLHLGVLTSPRRSEKQNTHKDADSKSTEPKCHHRRSIKKRYLTQILQTCAMN